MSGSSFGTTTVDFSVLKQLQKVCKETVISKTFSHLPIYFFLLKKKKKDDLFALDIIVKKENDDLEQPY